MNGSPHTMAIRMMYIYSAVVFHFLLFFHSFRCSMLIYGFEWCEVILDARRCVFSQYYSFDSVTLLYCVMLFNPMIPSRMISWTWFMTKRVQRPTNSSKSNLAVLDTKRTFNTNKRSFIYICNKARQRNILLARCMHIQAIAKW